MLIGFIKLMAKSSKSEDIFKLFFLSQIGWEAGKPFIHNLANAIDAFIAWVGGWVKWLALAMVVVMAMNVSMRYAFNAGDPWQQEIVRFMHGMLFLLGGAYALQQEQHVRVDVLYHRFTGRTKAMVNIIGSLLFLFPVAFALIYFSYDFVMNSWDIHEGSSQYKGMPGVYLLKSCILACGGMLILQGIGMMMRNVAQLLHPDLYPDVHHAIEGEHSAASATAPAQISNQGEK